MRKLAVAVLAAALTGGTVVGVATAGEATAAAPTVNMEAVIKAAMWDPSKPNQDITPGSGESVRVVEQALADENLLADAYVDGHFGTATVSAYQDWQQSLGFSGLDASGLPGTTSLTRLGDGGRYSLTGLIDIGGKTTMDGETVNRRSADMLGAAQRRIGVDFVLTQGSYNPGGDPSSAGTHDGGGVVDLSVHNLPSPWQAVKALREVGFAAWHRTPDQGPWAAHIHAVAVSDTALSPPAWDQVGDYFEGRNGLANNGPDDGPQVEKVTWEEYQRR
ncbi:peptidoglycan-binding protein [Saccharomonospora iraqiensis]|uniref:peptidoglycan-binding protein n=1 Tax=Saccharomonospora iraqiensis TaxID=52698 RepID=UPI00022E039D|nr:peptidoglycan-binding protein [Saccharomonospora iraqiensis]